MTHAEIVNQKYQADLKRAQAKDAATANLRELTARVPVNIMVVGEFKGHQTISFGEGSKVPFSFGASKAKQLLHAIDTLGMDVVINAIRAIAGQT